MIKATMVSKDTYPTQITDQNGKTMTICSSRVESAYLSPRQLLQGAVAGCLSMTIRRVLWDNQVEFSDVVVTVDMPQVDGTYQVAVEVKIDSNDDPVKVQACKDEAMKSCFIKGLVETGMKVVEQDLSQTEEEVVYERCCE